MCEPKTFDKLILFRVDAGCNVGLGHLSRSTALAYEFYKKGWVVIMVVGADSSILETLRDQNWISRVVQVDPNSMIQDPVNDASLVLRLLKQIQAKTIICLCDNYLADLGWQRVIRDKFGLIVIDDGTTECLAHIAIGPFSGAQRILTSNHDSKRVAGSGLQLVSREVAEFLSIGHSHRDLKARNNGKLRLVVNFGAVDSKNFLLDTFYILQSAPDFYEWDVWFVKGLFYPSEFNGQWTSLANFSHVHLVEAGFSNPFLKFNADLAIGGGGVSMIERAALKIPSVTMITSANQLQQAEAFKEQRLTYLTSKEDLTKLVSRGLSHLKDAATGASTAAHRRYPVVDNSRLFQVIESLLHNMEMSK